MHEDKRVIKTKRHLKSTLIEMLKETNFDKITVKDLCEKSQTSRITFYTHFDDKYELADSIFKDMIAEIDAEFKKIRLKIISNDAVSTYCGLLNCILDVYYKNHKVFSRTILSENQYLYFSFRKYITGYVEEFTANTSEFLNLKYSPKKISGFLCFGIWGFINMGFEQGTSPIVLKREVSEILENIIKSNVITEK